MTRIFLTGASGFVGGALLRRLAADGLACTVLLRRPLDEPLRHLPVRTIESPTLDADFAAALAGQDAVIHCAARVHVMQEQSADPLAEFRQVNVEGTLSLARQAAAAGVKRFIFLSSIKVNGEQSLPGRPFRPEDEPAPADPYGVSKLEAEQGLRALAAQTGMQVVIIRPVLVYGPGVKANFESLLRWLQQGLPLPLGAIHNQRSLVALDNLVDLLVTCIEHPAAANQTLLVSDGEDLSTSELLRRLAAALGRPARLLPVPGWILAAGAAMLGRRALGRRLCCSLQVDIGKTRQLLGWSPPVSVDEGLRRTARHWLAEQTAARR
ncbi:SDR family oxidoreductase [Pseudomonas sp. N040]|nr:SDR family oxidoreductase [Pseudomonas sp. N040]